MGRILFGVLAAVASIMLGKIEQGSINHHRFVILKRDLSTHTKKSDSPVKFPVFNLLKYSA